MTQGFSTMSCYWNLSDSKAAWDFRYKQELKQLSCEWNDWITSPIGHSPCVRCACGVCRGESCIPVVLSTLWELQLPSLPDAELAAGAAAAHPVDIPAPGSDIQTACWCSSPRRSCQIQFVMRASFLRPSDSGLSGNQTSSIYLYTPSCLRACVCVCWGGEAGTSHCYWLTAMFKRATAFTDNKSHQRRPALFLFFLRLRGEAEHVLPDAARWFLERAGF